MQNPVSGVTAYVIDSGINTAHQDFLYSRASEAADCFTYVDCQSGALTPFYNGIGHEYAGHESVCHSAKEYARGDVHTNTAESSFALVKRGIVGIYHNVSKKHLHRYLWQYDFLWNNRALNDGDLSTGRAAIFDGQERRDCGLNFADLRDSCPRLYSSILAAHRCVRLTLMP
jgi:hypothetical protein